MLSHSIASFQSFLGSSVSYVVCTDEPLKLKRHLLVEAELVKCDSSSYYSSRTSHWRKWAPSPRLALGDVEVYIDADVFLLQAPPEMLEFLRGDTAALYMVTLENSKVDSYYGNFIKRLDDSFAPINAGVLGQSRDSDISAALGVAKAWWTAAASEPQHYDEQGAIADILQDPIRSGQVALLPPDRYRVVSASDPYPVELAPSLVMLHASHAGHLAFGWFLNAISQITRLETPRQGIAQ